MILKDRFWIKVKKAVEPEKCWEWMASLDNRGYGRFKFYGKMIGAHRMAFILSCGDIPDGMCVLHKCDNPICVRPSHLFLGTLKDNSQDMIRKGRMSDFKGENNQHSKLKETDIKEIRDMGERGLKVKKISEIKNISVAHTYNILSGYRWSHI